MRCRQVHEWMSLELDGQLPAAEARALEAHLAGCASCAEAWAQWQEIASLFAAAPMVEPPEGLAARVLVRVQEQKPRWSALAASLAVIGLGLALLTGLVVVPLAGACVMATATVQMPSVLGAASGVVASLVGAAAVLAEGARLMLRAVLTPHSLALAAAYPALAAVTVAAWLRVAILKKAPARQAL